MEFPELSKQYSGRKHFWVIGYGVLEMLAKEMLEEYLEQHRHHLIKV